MHFFLAFEIWGLVTFHEQCRENLEYVNEILEVMEENKRNMTRTNDNITALMSDYTIVSRKLYTLKDLNYMMEEQHLRHLAFFEICNTLTFFTKVGRAAFPWNFSSFFYNRFTAFTENNYLMSQKRKHICQVKVVTVRLCHVTKL